MGKSSSQLTTTRPELMNNDGDSSSNAKRKRPMSAADNGADDARLPLSDVVSICNARWFQDSLKEAKSGDVNMQVLVAQMYYCGYGVPVDANKGKTWMARAARVRPSVWKVQDKPPGYNASDSDSDESASDS